MHHKKESGLHPRPGNQTAATAQTRTRPFFPSPTAELEINLFPNTFKKLTKLFSIQNVTLHHFLRERRKKFHSRKEGKSIQKSDRLDT
jgi:hypothetical protein